MLSIIVLRNASTYVCPRCRRGCCPPLVSLRPNPSRLTVCCDRCDVFFSVLPHEVPIQIIPAILDLVWINIPVLEPVVPPVAPQPLPVYRCPHTRRPITIFRWQRRGQARYLSCPHCHNWHAEHEALAFVGARPAVRTTGLGLRGIWQRVAGALGRLALRRVA